MYVPRFILSGVVLVAAALAAQPATAQFGGIVYDPTNYSQNILTAARTLEQINNQIRQLQNQATSLINEAKNLTTLPLTILQPLQQQIQQTQKAFPSHRTYWLQVSRFNSRFNMNFRTGQSEVSENFLSKFNGLSGGRTRART